MVLRAGAPAITTDDAVRIALGDSPRIRAARLASVAAQAQTDRERPVALPLLSLQAETRLQGPRVTFPRAGDGDATVLPEQYSRVELSLEQLLYRPGASLARGRYAAETRANALDLLREQNDLRLAVRHAFLDLAEAQAMVGVADEGADTARRHLRQARLMLEAGLTPERDVKSAEADAAEAAQQAARAANGAALARGNLDRLLGRDPAEPLTIAPPAALPPPPPAYEPAADRAARDRPELAALREHLRGARAGVDLAASQAGPSLSAQLRAVQQTPSAFASSRYYAGGLHLRWNLIDRGESRVNAREAAARTGQLEAQLDDAVLGIRLEVAKAIGDDQTARARLTSAAGAVESARAALHVSELRYAARAALLLEVAGARVALSRALGERERALYDVHRAAVDLEHATAAGLSPPGESGR